MFTSWRPKTSRFHRVLVLMSFYFNLSNRFVSPWHSSFIWNEKHRKTASNTDRCVLSHTLWNFGPTNANWDYQVFCMLRFLTTVQWINILKWWNSSWLCSLDSWFKMCAEPINVWKYMCDVTKGPDRLVMRLPHCSQIISYKRKLTFSTLRLKTGLKRLLIIIRSAKISLWIIDYPRIIP